LIAVPSSASRTAICFLSPSKRSIDRWIVALASLGERDDCAGQARTSELMPFKRPFM
jgi:hypothetical protein